MLKKSSFEDKISINPIFFFTRLEDGSLWPSKRTKKRALLGLFTRDLSTLMSIAFTQKVNELSQLPKTSWQYLSKMKKRYEHNFYICVIEIHYYSFFSVLSRCLSLTSILNS